MSTNAPTHAGPVLHRGDAHAVIDCAQCGFAHLDPKPTVAALEEFYRDHFFEEENPDYLAKTEREIEYWESVVYAKKEAVITSYLGKPGRILDIGCCGGFFLHYFARKGWAVQGVEPGRAAYDWATTKYKLPVVQALFESVPESDLGTFDAIHFAFVLEHVLEPIAFLEKVRRLLRPGGVVCIESPNDFNQLQKAAVQALNKHAWWVAPPDHLNYFSFDSMERVLQRTGFSVLRRQGTFPMELFLLMGDDYIGNDAVGLTSHQKRMRLEQRLQAAGFGDLADTLYTGFAQAGLGGQVILYGRRER